MENNTHKTNTDPTYAAQQVLELIEKMSQELRSKQHQAILVELDSHLQRDLGFDSLSRAELLLRVENQFAVSLPEQALATIETPRDLLRELLHCSTPLNQTTASQQVEKVTLDVVESLPSKVETLPQLLDWHVATHPARPHLYVYKTAHQIVEVSYQSLRDKALQIATGLIALGVEPGDRVAIMLPTSCDYFYSFYAILYLRAIPVPIYPPSHYSQIEDHLKRHINILQNAQVKLLITVEQAKPLSQLLKMQVPSIVAIACSEELTNQPSEHVTDPIWESHHQSGDDIAFLQYTSGSTGTPKGVALSHVNLLANIRAMGRVVGASSKDVFVSWLPVYHDMGLIGAWLGSLYHAMPLAIMSPLVFLTRPQRWLWAIHHHGGTLSPAPNFAYELCINKIDDSEIQGLDLSRWRLSWNGAEPVSPTTMRRFSAKFAPYGFHLETMSPVYGLAESSVGLTFPTQVRKPRVEHFLRKPLTDQGRAELADANADSIMELVGLGQPLPGHQIRIVDALGQELPERQEGELEFKGPSATQGYYRDSAKTAALYHDDWLRTGDKAFTFDGELFLTGRIKDIIIRAGRNIYPQELEEAVSQIADVRKGCVAAFACEDKRKGTERLVLVAETHHIDNNRKAKIIAAVNNIALELLDSAVDEVVIAAPHTIPKTSSGKIRRAACKELYQQGHLDFRQNAIWLQVIHLLSAGAVPQFRRYWRTCVDLSYAGYCWLLMGIIAPIVWSLVAAIPNSNWCWAVTRFGAQALIWLTGTKLTLKGQAHLPAEDQPSILVANHSSYLDAVVAVAVTGIKCRFVAKSELVNNPFARIFLSRLDTEFVERFDVTQGIADAKRLQGLAQTSRPLFIFPEGTFYRMAGLHEFHLGAFIAAAEAQIPVVPFSISGTRSILRGDSLFPRRGEVSVVVSEPCLPRGRDWDAALELKNQVRAEILTHCHEPDLA